MTCPYLSRVLTCFYLNRVLVRHYLIAILFCPCQTVFFLLFFLIILGFLRGQLICPLTVVFGPVETHGLFFGELLNSVDAAIDVQELVYFFFSECLLLLMCGAVIGGE